MAIYLIYWLFLTVASLIEIIICEFKSNVKLHKALKIIVFALLIFLIGFRWRTGTDWEPYLYFFKWTHSRTFFASDDYMEYGYVIFNNICHFLSNDYSILLIIHASTFYFLLFKGFKSFTDNIILCVFLYTAMYFGMVGSNRQLLAVALGFYSLTNYLNKNFKSAIVLLFIAVSFHITAILMLLYLFFKKEYKLNYIIIAFIVAIIVGQSGLVESVFGFVGTTSDMEGKVEAYKESTGPGTELSIIGIVRRAVMVFLLLYYSRILRLKYVHFNICLNAYLYSVAGFFMFASIPVLAGRGMLYFNIFEPVLIIYMVSLLKSIKISLLGYGLLFILIIVFFIQAINLYPELFIPYQGIFINTEYYRPMG